LSAFEEWLENATESSAAIDDRTGGQRTGAAAKEEKPPSLSKNKLDQLQKEVAQLEQKIAAIEAELAQLELSFQNPATGTDWESTHRRYAELKVTLDNLYEDLAGRWELMGH
jgi:phage shock protein A